MIIRIRTNYGVWKVDLDESKKNSFTIDDLLTYLSDRYKLNTNGIILVKDTIDPKDPMAMAIKYERDQTLASYHIGHGDMIKILNKLKKIEVEKSFIEDGHLIPAGISYCVDENEPLPSDDMNISPSLTTVTPLSSQEESKGRNVTNKIKEETTEKKISETKPSSVLQATKSSLKQVREEDPYAAQVKETPTKVTDFHSLCVVSFLHLHRFPHLSIPLI